MITTIVMVLLSMFIVFAIGFIAGVTCAASGAAEHFEEVVLKSIRAKEKNNVNKDTG